MDRAGLTEMANEGRTEPELENLQHRCADAVGAWLRRLGRQVKVLGDRQGLRIGSV